MALTKERIAIYRETIKQWGIDAQINMAIEEMAELISTLQHYRRLEKWGHHSTLEDVIDEIADVEIMMEQLRFMFNINAYSLYTIKEKKLARVKELLGMK